MDRYIYKKNDIGLKILSELELNGGYPNWFNDEEVHRYNTHWIRPKKPSDIKEYILNTQMDKSIIVFSVYSIKDSKHIGNVSLQNIDHFNQSAEMAFLFGERAYWGKGYAYTASDLIIKHAFNHLNMHRLYLGCLIKNKAMKSLALKLGFIQEGIRKSAIYSNGEYSDVVEFGLLKDEKT